MSEQTLVDIYLANLAPDRHAALTELRSLIRETVPDAVETLKYRMPTYEYRGGVLCAFASQKHYMSLYMETGIVARHQEELARLNLGKSCVRFRSLEQLPLGAVKRMLLETERNLASL